MKMVEVRPIKGFDKCTIDATGVVYYEGNILKSYIEKRNNHSCVMLPCEGKKKRRIVHRLLAEAFVPNPNNYKNVRKINTECDYTIDNLEWYTNAKKDGKVEFTINEKDVIDIFINNEKKHTSSGKLVAVFNIEP